MDPWRDIHFQAGTQLQPQHFQLLQRQLSFRSADWSGPVSPFAYGVVSAEVDHNALEGGILRFTSLHVRFRSGLVLHGASNVVIESLSLGGSSGISGPQAVYLVVSPMASPSGSPESHGGKGLCTELIADDTTGGDARPVTFRKWQAQLSLRPPPAGTDGMPVCMIEPASPSAVPRWIVSDSFTPPCLVAGASPVLATILDTLEREFSATFRSLRKKSRETTPSSASSSAIKTVRDVLACKSCARVASTLESLRSLPSRGGPWNAFVELKGALHELCALLPEAADPRDCQYNHDDPGPCFENLRVRIVPLLRSLRMVEVRRLPFLAGVNQRPTATLASSDEFGQGDVWLLVNGLGAHPASESLLTDNKRFKLIAQTEESLMISGVPLLLEKNPPQDLQQPGTLLLRVETQTSPRWRSILNCRKALLMWGMVEINLATASFQLAYEVDTAP